MRYFACRGGEKNGLITLLLISGRIFGDCGKTHPRRGWDIEDHGIKAMALLQAFGLALAIVGCHYDC